MRTRRTKALPLAPMLALLLALCVAGLLPAPPPASAGPAQIMYFMHLGSLWQYDAGTGEATRNSAFDGERVGNLSWSRDNLALALETVRAEYGEVVHHVWYDERVSVPGEQTVHLFPGRNPSVSSDGSMVVFEVPADGHSTLVVYNALTDSEVVLPHGKNGNLTTVSGGTTVLFNRDDDPFPTNPAIHCYALYGHFESLFPVLFPGEPEGQSNAWAPQSSPNGLSFLATKYLADSSAVYVVGQSGVAGTRPQSLVEVSKDVAWNYRWLLQPSDVGLPLIERLRYGSTRPDIYLIPDSPTIAPYIRFHNSSFGFNVSVPESSPFSDLVNGDAHYHPAAYMQVAGIISGFPDGTFRPADPITRAQFAKMIDGALELDVWEGTPLAPFTDLGENVSPLHPVQYVSAAWAASLIQGYSDGTFRPWNQITRAQVMTMAVRAAQRLFPEKVQPVPDGWTGQLSWYADPTHGANAHLAEYDHLLDDITLTGWNPDAPARRDEVAQILYDLMEVRGPLMPPPD